MIISNTTKKDLVKALELVNQKFDGNVKFYKCESTNKKGTRFVVRLKVNDSSQAGAKTSVSQLRKDGNYRRSSWACWHVHGEFHDALNSDAVIRTGGLDLNHQNEVKMPGDEWLDWDRGSLYYGSRMASECCDC